MATNFEFYKEKIIDALKSKNSMACCCMKTLAALKNVDATELFQNRCRGRCCSECWNEVFEILKQEHSEEPKLTKRERAFCEAVQTGWIARDKNGSLFWYGAMPGTKGKAIWMCFDPRSYQMFNMGSLFKFITWSDEKPWSIEDLLKLEVIEEANE